jgi:hypothetical protein
MTFSTRGAESSAVEVWRLADGLGRRRWRILEIRRERRVELQQVASALTLTGGGGTEEPIAADLLKALGEDMLEKTCDEGLDGESEAPGLVCARADVAEGDTAVIEGFDAVVGEGDAMDIAGEVLGGVLAVASVPRFAEDCRLELTQEILAVEGVADLGAEDLGEGVTRDEEAGMGRLAPGFALIGQPAGGGEEMDVGVVGEITRPGVEHRQDAEFGADPLGIVGEELEGGCGLTQEQVVDGALVRACERAELGGEGEGNKVVGAGQESIAQGVG